MATIRVISRRQPAFLANAKYQKWGTSPVRRVRGLRWFALVCVGLRWFGRGLRWFALVCAWFAVGLTECGWFTVGLAECGWFTYERGWFTPRVAGLVARVVGLLYCESCVVSRYTLSVDCGGEEPEVTASSHRCRRARQRAVAFDLWQLRSRSECVERRSSAGGRRRCCGSGPSHRQSAFDFIREIVRKHLSCRHELVLSPPLPGRELFERRAARR